MSNLIEHAERELKIAGVYEKDSDYGGMLARAVMELMQVFTSQGHSGASAYMTADLFSKLARMEALTPIGTTEDEWVDVSENFDGEPMLQNKRNPATFSKDGGKTWYTV